jgi:uncharacterized protein
MKSKYNQYMKKQVLVLHGGDTFDTYEEYLLFLKNYKIETLEYFLKKKWKSSLQKSLGDYYEVIIPEMPNKINAKYFEWKIWFEKVLTLLDDEIILVGHSLGGLFLAKYLSENAFVKKPLGVFLIAPPFDMSETKESLADFILPEDFQNLKSLGNKLHFYHSRDDGVVPFIELQKYKEKLPNSQFTIFDDKGHFNQEEFSELAKDIKNL